MTNFTKKLFEKSKHKVSIESPKKFRSSVRRLKKKGFTADEKRSLKIAQVRARALMRRDNLSKKEKREFKTITKIKLPSITKKKKR